MSFYKRDGSARHIEAHKSTPQWKARQRSAIVLVLLFVLCSACVYVSGLTCLDVSVCVCVCAFKCLHLKGVALVTQLLLLQASPPSLTVP